MSRFGHARGDQLSGRTISIGTSVSPVVNDVVCFMQSRAVITPPRASYGYDYQIPIRTSVPNLIRYTDFSRELVNNQACTFDSINKPPVALILFRSLE